MLIQAGCLENTSAIIEPEISSKNKNIAINVSDLNILETDSDYSTFDLTINFSEPLQANANLSITSIDGTARSGSDFVSISKQVQASKGTKEVVVKNVQIIGERTYESNESFYVKVTTDSTFSFTSSKNVGTVTILNNDLPPKISISDATAAELNKLVFKIEADAKAEVDILINYTTQDLSDATPALDYDSSSGQIVLKANETIAEINVFAPYDEVDEDEEVFGIEVSSPNTQVVFTDSNAIGTIVDNNGLPFVNFEETNVEYYETQGLAKITVSLDKVSGKDVVVPLSVLTNELDSDEHSPLPTSITIPEGSLRATTSFQLFDDSNMEASEKIIFEIASSIVDANRGNDKQLTITVAESDGLPETLENLVEKGIGFHIDGKFYKDQIKAKAVGDIDNDGKDDFVVFNNYGTSPNNQKRSYIFYGRDRYTENISLSSEIANTDIDYLTNTTGASYGSNYFPLPDINCDGIDDFMYTYNGNFYYLAGTQGRYDSSGDLTHFLNRYNTPNIPSAYKNIGDINGDGCDDLASSKTSYQVDSSDNSIEYEGRFYFKYNDGITHSGTANPTLYDSEHDFTITGTQDRERIGQNYSASKIGDINGDGYDDLFFGNRFSQAFIFPGKEEHYTSFTSDNYSANGGTRLASKFYGSGISMWAPGSEYVTDLNHDGFEDFMAYFPAARQLLILPGKTTPYANYNYYGNNPTSYNALVYEFYTSSGKLQVFDFNGDGYLDVIFGVETDDREGGPRLSSIFIKWGTEYTSGKIIMDNEYDHKILGELQGWYLEDLSSADINGDGIFDLILNYTNAYTTQFESGRVYVIYGGNLTDSMDIIGTNSDDILNGSSDSEIIFGAKGNDTINGGGGNDYIQGAAGDDTIIINDYSFRAIDGGPGTDFIGLQSYDLNISTGAIAKFRNIEGFDLKTSPTPETLTIGRAAVNKLNKSKKLYIKGTTGDKVVIVDESGTWSTVNNVVIDSTTYNIYRSTRTRAVFYIETDVSVQLP